MDGARVLDNGRVATCYVVSKVTSRKATKVENNFPSGYLRQHATRGAVNCAESFGSTMVKSRRLFDPARAMSSAAFPLKIDRGDAQLRDLEHLMRV